MVARRWPQILAWLALLLLLVAGLPIFLCMPLWGDVTLYDLAARNILRGGIHYRDIFDTNLPGMVWLHCAIRSVFGWHSETLRAVDFLVFASIAWLLVRWLRPQGLIGAGSVWMATALIAYYFSTTEWSHCQRDTWMLLPALAALYVRRRQLSDLVNPESSFKQVGLRALGEGMLWGAGFWIKPFVAVPALACLLVTAGWLWATRTRGARWRLAVDAASLLAGGLLVGAAGMVWLWWSGTWHYFWDVMLDWNLHYATGKSPYPWHWHAYYFFAWFFPWSLLHLAAVPIAVAALGRILACRSGQLGWQSALGGQESLLAAFYLGWLLQATAMQKLFEYPLTPLVPLALPLVVGAFPPLGRSVPRWGIVVGFAAIAIALHPDVRIHRISLWKRCCLEWSTPEIRNALQLRETPNNTDWVQLRKVKEFLQEQGVQGHDVTCYNNSTHPLYLLMDELDPSTPFLHFDTINGSFPDQHPFIQEKLRKSGHRFIVSDLRAVGLVAHKPLPPADAAEDNNRLAWSRVKLLAALAPSPQAGFPANVPYSLLSLHISECMPPKFPWTVWGAVYPWSEPVVYRAGRYLVHRATGPVGPLSTEP